MEKLNIANKRLKTAHDSIERDYQSHFDKLSSKEEEMIKRLSDLNKKKQKTMEANGNLEAADDDLIEVNAGGKIIAAKRSTLTQLKGTRFEALFSGRWDNKLQRDSHGRIFLDVNPTCFEVIVDYLNEMIISSEDDPPESPSVDDEHQHILNHQLELFGLGTTTTPDSRIIKTDNQYECLHGWLGEDGLDGDFNLLYRGSRDGLSSASFHLKCDNNGSTLTIIETTDGHVVGGYSNVAWASKGQNRQDSKAFVIVLSGNDTTTPCKMKLINANDPWAVYHSSSHGPTFGDYDLQALVNSEADVYLEFGLSYESGPPQLNSRYEIKEIEVFRVDGTSSPAKFASTKQKHTQPVLTQFKPVIMFTEGVNSAINAKQESLAELESGIIHLEESFKDEAHFVTAFGHGDKKDIVTLNVSGTIMVTKRSTLCIAEDSVLAQQFDDAKWTVQGCNNLRVTEWTADDVIAWAKTIKGIQEDVGKILKENKINGRELLALKRIGLTMLGITRTGTLCLLLEEIEMLRKASQDIATLIEHSRYCFCKILDYLRLKQVHTQGLIGHPALPKVCDSQKSRFNKVVKYYFPGASAKFITG